MSRRFHEPTYFQFIVPANSNQSHASNCLIPTYGNLGVVSDEDYEVSSSSEDSVREDEWEIEHGSAVSLPVRCIILPRTGISLEISLDYSDLKINQSVKTP